MTDSPRAPMLSVQAFVETCCERDELAREDIDVLYDAYSRSAASRAYRSAFQSQFNTDLLDLGARKDPKLVNHYLGFRLRRAA